MPPHGSQTSQAGKCTYIATARGYLVGYIRYNRLRGPLLRSSLNLPSHFRNCCERGETVGGQENEYRLACSKLRQLLSASR